MRNFWTGCLVLGVLLCAFWIQFHFLNLVPLWGIKANLGIVLVVTLSTLCGQGIGATIGTVYGVLSDILMGKALGIYTILFFLVGFFCGRMSKGFSKENKTAIVLITTGTTLLFEIASYLLMVIVYDYEWEIVILMKTVLLEGIYNMLMARFLFPLLSSLAEIINKGKRSYYLL